MSMSKSLIEIAKKNGAFIVKDEIGEDLVLPVSELLATINAYNAQMSEPVGTIINGYLLDNMKCLVNLQAYPDNTKLYQTHQTIPPEIAEYIEKIEVCISEVNNKLMVLLGSKRASKPESLKKGE